MDIAVLGIDLGKNSCSVVGLAPAAETWARTTVESNICTRCAVSLNAARASKKASKVPDRLKRQNRFQTLFQCPNFSGRARQVMLCTTK